MWSPWNTLGGLGMVVAGIAMPASASAADLPAHDPLRILVVSDQVNPHGLSDAELTQPGDLQDALGGAGSGLNVDTVDEVDSQCVDDALAALAAPGTVDVVVYFAHLAATGCDGSAQQDALTGAFEGHLQQGGGIVVFHHGIYEAGGKEGVLELLGGRASSIAWDPAAGQDVIATAPEHFVAAQGVEYPGMRSFGGEGVPEGDYPFFNNTPDERYDAMALLSQGGETRTILFASADGAGGSARVLGYDLHRAGWAGHVVFYQPGEYQPQALDDPSGNNFQILANAIVYAATTQEDGGTTSGGSTGGGGPTSDGGPADGSGGEGTSGASMGATGGGGDGSAGSSGGEDGCGCRSGGPIGGGVSWLMLAGLSLSRRRRRGGPARCGGGAGRAAGAAGRRPR